MPIYLCEILKDDAGYVCRAFADLEWYMPKQDSEDEERLILRYLKIYAEVWETLIPGGRVPEFAVTCGSRRDTKTKMWKASYHIICLNKYVASCKDNRATMALIAALEAAGHGSNNHPQGATSIPDRSVHSSNRVMRVTYSAKKRGDRPLLPFYPQKSSAPDAAAEAAPDATGTAASYVLHFVDPSLDTVQSVLLDTLIRWPQAKIDPASHDFLKPDRKRAAPPDLSIDPAPIPRKTVCVRSASPAGAYEGSPAHATTAARILEWIKVAPVPVSLGWHTMNLSLQSSPRSCAHELVFFLKFGVGTKHTCPGGHTHNGSANARCLLFFNPITNSICVRCFSNNSRTPCSRASIPIGHL